MATFPNECWQTLTFNLASQTAKQCSSPTTTIICDAHHAHPLTPCHHGHPWRPLPTTLVNRQQQLWHAHHITNQTRCPQQQRHLPPPPYWLSTTKANPAPNAAMPCHQPSLPHHQQQLRPPPPPHRQQHPHPQTLTSDEEHPRPHP